MKKTETTSKERTALWLYPETFEKMDKMIPIDNCKNRSEFIEKALNFYIGYLVSEPSTDYLSKILLGAIKGTLRESEDRQSANLFRLSVEMSMMMNILAAGLDVDDEQLYKLRGRCVREVKASKGKVSFEDALSYQRSDQ